MSELIKVSLTAIFLEVIQVKEGRKYKGSLRIGSLELFYIFESLTSLQNIKKGSLKKLKDTTRKILFPTQIFLKKGKVKKLVKQNMKGFVFFHNLIYPHIKRFDFDPEVCVFNKMLKENNLSCVKDTDDAINDPLELIIVPQKIYLFQLKNSDIPEDIFKFN